MYDFVENTASGLRYAFKKGESPDSPLIIGIHGKAGTLYVLQAFASTYPKNFNIAYFEAPTLDALGGYSWWDFDPVTEEAANQWSKAEAPAANLISAVAGLEIQQEISPAYKLGIGFSQGGGLLSVVAQLHPTYLGKFALLASFVVKPPTPIALDGLNIFWAHGELDDRIALGTAQRGVAYLQQQGADITFVTDSVGHKVGSQGMRGLKEFLA